MLSVLESAVRIEHLKGQDHHDSNWNYQMTIALWTAQGLLIVFFLAVGIAHTFMSLEKLKEGATWVRVVNPTLVRLIGVLEFLGAVGLVAPIASGIMPWLTPWAGLGLMATMLGATVFHASRREYHAMPINLIPLLLAAFVTVGYWS